MTAQEKHHPVFYTDNVTLYQADCLSLMAELAEDNPHGLFDMIFADPPYFLSNGGMSCHAGKMVSVNKGAWDQSLGPRENHKFNLEWISLGQKLLKPNGTLWVTGTHHVIHSVGFAMQCLGMKILNEIAWEKPNPPPNLSCRYFTHSTETILWAAKSKRSKHVFNYPLMRQLNNGKQMKTVWSIRAPKKSEKLFGKHPTQKPLDRLNRILLTSTNEGDKNFDPFMGSCSTGVASVQSNRKFVGCELEQIYLDLSILRLKSLQEATLFNQMARTE